MTENYAPLSPEDLLANEVCCGRRCLNCPFVPRHGKTAEVDWIWVEFFKANPESTYDDYLAFREEMISKD